MESRSPLISQAEDGLAESRGRKPLTRLAVAGRFTSAINHTTHAPHIRHKPKGRSFAWKHIIAAWTQMKKRKRHEVTAESLIGGDTW